MGMVLAAKVMTARVLARLGEHANRSVHRRLDRQQRDLDELRLLVGRLHAERIRGLDASANLHEAEFRVFSQWGQDGILEHLLNHVPVEDRAFVEFGVQDYRESNTRFLLEHRNWRGLVMDGDEARVQAIRSADLYWRHQLQAVHAFVTVENINGLIRDAGFEGDIGLLSIDIDGMDYWVWKGIEVVDPRVVVCEYNSLFGPEAAVAVPYDPEFGRGEAHYSHLYFGASLAALNEVGEAKGYRFVGCNSAGNDAFFVREDCVGGLRALTPAEGFMAARARESRDASGVLTHLDRDAARAEIGDMEVEDVRTGDRLKVRDLDGR